MNDDDPGVPGLDEGSIAPREELSDGVDQIIHSWLTDLPQLDDCIERPDDLLTAYRELARAVVGVALSPDGEAASQADDLDAWVPELSRHLGRVTAVNRKSGVGISETLEDFGRLAPTVLTRLRSVGDSTVSGDPLRLAEGIVRLVGRVLQRLARLMEESATRAQREQSETLAAMTEMLSHELRNRLGAARTASEMLVSTDLELHPDHVKRAARLVRLSVEDALRTVDDVRGLAATRAHLESHRERPVELPRLIHAVVGELEAVAADEGVDVIAHDDLAPAYVDASRVRLILFNLIGNGIKYHDPDEERPCVWISTEMQEDDCVEIRVRDNGIGISEEDLESVFDYRVRGSAPQAVPGSGLGLAIAREATEQMQGRLSVESALGEGSTFSVVIRILEPPEDE